MFCNIIDLERKIETAMPYFEQAIPTLVIVAKSKEHRKNYICLNQCMMRSREPIIVDVL